MDDGKAIHLSMFLLCVFREELHLELHVSKSFQSFNFSRIIFVKFEFDFIQRLSLAKGIIAFVSLNQV